MTDYYKLIKDILGATGVIIPIADGHVGIENAAHTNVTTQGDGGAHVWTYQPGTRNGYSLSTVSLRGRGRIPILSLNGTNEYLSTPDIDYYSRGDSLLDYPFSCGIWVNLRDATSNPFINKAPSLGGATAEWAFGLDSADRLVVDFRDVSAAVLPERRGDAAITSLQNSWRFISFSYDGGGGATAMNGVVIYIDGAVHPSSAANNASYVAMENSTQTPIVGTLAGSFLKGSVAGGPLGPFYTQVALSAAQMRSLFLIGLDAQKNLGFDIRRLGRR